MPGERGDLGACNFVYRCVNVTDAACVGGQPALPVAVAVGGRFQMSCTVSSGPLPAVISPAGDITRDDGLGFQVLRPGWFSLLAVTGNSEVIDIKHMRASAVAEVRVQPARELPVARLTLARGQTVELSAVPFDAQGVVLGGALSYAWKSADERHLTVETLPQLNTVRVRAGSDGSTTLMVTVAGQTFPITVVVGEGPIDGGVQPIDSGVLDATLAVPDSGSGDASQGGDV